MASVPEQPDRPGDDELPDAFVAELHGVAVRNVPTVPADLDAAILRDAKAGFARRRRFRLAARVAVGVAAAAAAVAIALPILHRSQPRGTTASRTPTATQMLSVMPAPAAAEDVDHSGKVDILDAFVVAKLVETGKQVDAAYDVNGDGKVDRSDVDRIANAAVAVAPQPVVDRRVQ